MNFLNARNWSRARFLTVGLLLLASIVLLQVLVSNSGGTASIAAATVSALLAIPLLYISVTAARGIDERRGKASNTDE